MLTPNIVLPHDRGDEDRSNLFLWSPRITWTLAYIDEERGFGLTKSRTISFSSSESLVNVEIYVSPELRRLVRVHPTRLQRVEQGQNIFVSITIAASKAISLGKANGSIQVVSNALRPEVLFEALPVTVLVTMVPFPSDPGRCEMGKVLECAKVDPSSDCKHIVRGETEEEVLKKAGEHAKEHGIREVTPDMMARVKANIRNGRSVTRYRSSNRKSSSTDGLLSLVDRGLSAAAARQG